MVHRTSEKWKETKRALSLRAVTAGCAGAASAALWLAVGLLLKAPSSFSVRPLCILRSPLAR